MIAVVAAGMPVAWLIARAAGLVAFALLTVSVTLGLLMSTRLLKPRGRRALLGWHQTLMWTGLAMLVLHGGAILLDPVMRFGFIAVVVPGAAPWRPITVAAGIVAGYLMLALAVSFHVRRRIGQRRWRLLHYASFAAFALALGHALHAGTDLRGRPAWSSPAIALAPVLWLTFARILMPRPAAPPRAEATSRAAGRRALPRRAHRHRRERCRHDRRPARAGVVPAMGTECVVAATATRADDRARAARLAAGRARGRGLRAGALALPARQRPVAAERAPPGRGARSTGGSIDALRAALRVRARRRTGRSTRRSCPALAAAGYDRSFEQLDGRPPAAARGWRPGAAVEIDPASQRARVEAGAAVDLGGIGKGFAAARALWAMREAWLELPGGLVDLGGDIAVWGAHARGRPVAARHRRPARAGRDARDDSSSTRAPSPPPGATSGASAPGGGSTT